MLEARPARIQLLAGQVAREWPAAADQITALAREFAYESLSKALDPQDPDDQAG